VLKLLIICLLLLFSSTSSADEVEKIKMSLQMNPNQVQKDGARLKPLNYLKKRGFFDNVPDLKSDYSHVYFPKKPIRIFDTSLLAFDIEYLETYNGCCVNPGVAIVLEKNGGARGLSEFAKRNTCRVTNIKHANLPPEIADRLKLTHKLDHLVVLSCKESDRNRE